MSVANGYETAVVIIKGCRLLLLYHEDFGEAMVVKMNHNISDTGLFHLFHSFFIS